MITEETGVKLADRLWIAVALLQREMPLREDFLREEIRRKLREIGLMSGFPAGSYAAHLKEHLVANVPASSTKYRMLYEPRPGFLRLYRPGDLIDPSRQSRRPSKHIPKREEIPLEYRHLLDWYEEWSRNAPKTSAPNFDDDPLLRLRGSGRHIWADEHADEYVANLRREDW